MAFSRILLGRGTAPAQLLIRDISLRDLKEVLTKGIDDFNAMPTHAIFLGAIYPIVGLVLARLAFGYSTLSLIYPLTMGFALVGPLAALGLYELSRRREAGDKVSVSHAFDILQLSSIGAIAAIGILLIIVFGLWLAVANALYVSNFGHAPPASLSRFVHDLFMTRPGWMLIVVGNAVGLCFALVAFTISVVSFPLLLDRDVGAAVALWTSIRVVARNPLTMAAWGLTIGVLLALGSLPCFLGLAVVIPVLGHASWHLYRKAVVADPSPPPEPRTPSMIRRFAADFPAALFPWGK